MRGVYVALIFWACAFPSGILTDIPTHFNDYNYYIYTLY